MMKLLYFPDPYPDEDFRSIIYRYHIRTANKRFSKSNIELFRKKSYKNPMFPTCLSTLIKNLPLGHSYNIKSFIFDNTWYGLIKAFSKKEDDEKFMAVFRDGSDNHFWLTKKFSSLFSTTIKYCPNCMIEDIQSYGEMYVHRDHQLNFLDFCPKHFVQLIDRCGHCNDLLCKEYAEDLLRVPYCKHGHYLLNKIHKLDLEDPIIKIKLDLYRILISIRDNNYLLSPQKIHHKLLMMLWKKGFIHYRGKVLNQRLINSIVSDYPKKLFDEINLPHSYIKNKYFVNNFIRNSDFQVDIVFYCLLILYLYKTIDNLIEFDEPLANPIPFGNGPWKCLNKICENNNKSTIFKCKRVLKSSGGMCITGEFSCPSCGYIYVKRWHPNKNIKEKPMVKTMGNIWYEKLFELYSKGYSAYSISKILQSSEFAVRSNLEKIIGTSKKLEDESKKDSFNELLQSFQQVAGTQESIMERTKKYRLIILNKVLNENPESRTDIYNELTKEYNWLKIHDKEWLESVIPEPIIQGVKKRNFSQMDKELANKIENIANELYATNRCQIKKETILKHLNSTEVSRIKSIPNELPLSISTLNSSIESLNNHFIRRLPFVIEELKSKGLRNITFNAIVSHAPIFKKCDNVMKNKIINLLEGKDI